MCGMSGFNWKDGEKINAMVRALSHRGPDANGTYTDEGISLGHNRLSVIDLSSHANQPMFDNLGDLVVVYNGEIYNFLDLKKELESSYKFKTKSDTEVILAGYRKWGKGMVDKLNGMFAFVIWDKRSGEIFAARDHMGIKPFYYYWDNKKFIFASEIKAILEHDIPRKLNLPALNKYLRVLYSPEPETLVKNIFKLPPGSILIFKDGNLKIEKYYLPTTTKAKNWKYDDAVRGVHDVIMESTQRQLVADVPVGVYLSGGIDSSVVLSSVSKIKPKVKTFSIGFDLEESEDRYKFNRDFELAGETAKFFGAEHYPLTISASDVASKLEKIIASIDDPISNPTAIPMAFLSHFAKKEVTVVFSGDGGDELFGGYDRYMTSRRADFVDSIPTAKYFLPEKIRKIVEMPALNRLVQFEFEKDFRLEKVVNSKFFIPMIKVRESFDKYLGDTENKTEALMMADLRSWLPDQALSLGDKMSMVGSLEERVPLLDRDVVDLAMGLPLNFKVTPFTTKKILKDAFKKELPKNLFTEPKRGWFSPGAKWIRRGEIEKIFRNVLSPGYYTGTEELFEWYSVEKMLDNHISKKEYNLTILWAIFSFQVWAKQYEIKI